VDKIIVITGATACGKTDAAIETALLIDGEIISADSMQVYRQMDIGTATPTIEEMRGVKHWLISEFDPDEDYSVSVFCEKANSYIKDIISRGKTPIICGGTGFYINALLYGNDFGETNMDLRTALIEFAERNGAEALFERLMDVDPKAARSMHPNNIRRVARALDFFLTTGSRFSEHNENEKQRQPVFDASTFILTMERQALYNKIEQRVDLMLEKGLVTEVERLLEMGYSETLQSMQGLGYKEIVKYLNKSFSLDEAIETLKTGTRRFAKRQGTWFRHQLNGVWLNKSEFNDTAGFANEITKSVFHK